MIGEGGEREFPATPREWQAFLDALQVLVLVADAAVKRLRQHDHVDACRDVVAATTRVLELAHDVLPRRKDWDEAEN